MKTFEEAITSLSARNIHESTELKQVLARHDSLIQEVNDSPVFSDFIAQCLNKWDEMNLDDAELAIAAFKAGLMVGMAMEKQE